MHHWYIVYKYLPMTCTQSAGNIVLLQLILSFNNNEDKKKIKCLTEALCFLGPVNYLYSAIDFESTIGKDWQELTFIRPQAHCNFKLLFQSIHHRRTTVHFKCFITLLYLGNPPITVSDENFSCLLSLLCGCWPAASISLLTESLLMKYNYA